MEDLNKLIKELKGESDPVFYKCVIAVTICGDAYLIEGDPILVELLDGCDLGDNLTSMNNVPTNPGIYRCKIKVDSFTSHHPEDPVEWDMNITVEECKRYLTQIKG